LNTLKMSKEAIINKAEFLGIEYEARHKGCGQCTFLAIVDALRWGGLEIMTEEMENRLFSGVCLLTAGVVMTGDGTCGALASSVIVMGIALGIPRETQDDSLLRAASATVRDTLLTRHYKEYNSLLCKDVQRKFFGKAWDLTRDDMSRDFLGITHGCIIMQSARWATEIILDEFEKGNVRIPVQDKR
jgi:hypothetical protein